MLVLLAISALGGVAHEPELPVARPHSAGRRAGSPEIRSAVARRPSPALSIRAQTTHQTAIAGASVAYQVRITRVPRLICAYGRGHPRVAARIWLGVTKPLPAGLAASFGPQPTRASMVTLTVRTSTSSRRGDYRLRITAHGGLCDDIRYCTRWAATGVRLSVISPPHPALTIRGTQSGLLSPGRSARIDLRLTNATRWGLKVNHLLVSITGLRAPRADLSHPCTTKDFKVSQFSGSYGFALRPRSTRNLGQLGFAAKRWPALAMLDRPVDQDGCQSAAVSLSFSARTTGGSR